MVRVHPIAVRLAMAYLIEGPEGMLLVDAGMRGSEGAILHRMRELGRGDLKWVFITHAHLDHYGSAAALRRMTGARVVVHRHDAQAMAAAATDLGKTRGRGTLTRWLFPLFDWALGPPPTPADLLVEEGDFDGACGFAAEVLHTPGHTPGSSCLLVAEHAFAGDLLSSYRTPHTQTLYAVDWEKVPDSLEKLKRRAPRWIYPGHGRRPISLQQLQALSY